MRNSPGDAARSALEVLRRNGVDSFDETPELPAARPLQSESGDEAVYARSLKVFDRTLYAMLRARGEKYLFAVSRRGIDSDIARIALWRGACDGVEAALWRPDWDAYVVLRAMFPFIEPVSLRGKRTTIGVGDRLGIATPGHIRAVRDLPVAPVLAQQSIRELTLTNRTYREVVADAAFGVFQEGYTAGYGADGDHLKTLADIDVALDAGTPMITLDLTEVMDPRPAEWPISRIEERFAALDERVRETVGRLYAERSFPVEGETIRIRAEEAMRCALMYWRALDFAERVDAHLARKRKNAYDLEISIDETTAPTLPSHHLFIARELERRGVSVNSLAPRFVGEFQKGIDYIGDPTEFGRQFATHCRIARSCGDYKISIHSGSDKFAVYPIVGRETHLRVHVKTAGTSWLEAVRTVARVEPTLYRLMHAKAFDYFDEATKLYHISADVSAIPPVESVSDEELPAYLDRDESRQLLHITYGGLLNDPEVRGRFFEVLDRSENAHHETLAAHIRRHLDVLGVPSRK